MALKPLDADEGYTKPKKGKKAKAAREASDEESEMDLDPVSDWMPQQFFVSESQIWSTRAKACSWELKAGA